MNRVSSDKCTNYSTKQEPVQIPKKRDGNIFDVEKIAGAFFNKNLLVISDFFHYLATLKIRNKEVANEANEVPSDTHEFQKLASSLQYLEP